MAHRGRRLRSYRGRSKKGLILLIAALLVLAAIGYGIFWLFDHITLNADGTVTVNMPWMSQSPPVSSLPPSEPAGPTDITVLTPTPAPETPAPTPSPTPTPTPEPDWRMVFVSQSQLASAQELDALAERARGIGANALVLDYKADSGVLLTDEQLASARGRLGTEFLLIARISVYLDDTMPKKHGSWGVKHTSNVNWINVSGRWLNPYQADPADYLLGCVTQAIDLGFDGILLDNLAFPWYGSIEKISYGENADTPRRTAIDSFIESVAALNAKIPVGAVALPETVELGRYETAGQVLATFMESFDFIVTGYLAADGNTPRGFTPLINEGYSEDFRSRMAAHKGNFYWYRP